MKYSIMNFDDIYSPHKGTSERTNMMEFSPVMRSQLAFTEQHFTVPCGDNVVTAALRDPSNPLKVVTVTFA